ncbi:MAG: protein tyrosine phosphatase [Hyphomicrobiaceae bacterium]|nr:protein tyrosine phosphatase [Hyphomicrobiaceae bacterium]
MTLWVCPHSQLETTLQKSGARHLLALVSDPADFKRPGQIPQNQFHLSVMNDIVEPRDGLTAPSLHHLEALLDFNATRPASTPLVLTCYAGISRSTASAYILACAAKPTLDEHQLAQKLRCLSPSATPNIRLITLADKLLERKGRMTKAIAAIGRGAEAFEGEPFVLEV